VTAAPTMTPAQPTEPRRPNPKPSSTPQRSERRARRRPPRPSGLARERRPPKRRTPNRRSPLARTSRERASVVHAPVFCHTRPPVGNRVLVVEDDPDLRGLIVTILGD